MNIEALPKILFINEENDEMTDRRIRVKVQYDTTGVNPVKKTIKKINNTISLTETLTQNLEINSLAYSNKFGLLITCIQGQILITDWDHLETYIATSDTSAKSLKQISTSIDFSGKVYMAPNQSKFLAINRDQFLLFDLDTQKIITKGANEHHLRHIVFVAEESFAGWNFQSTAYLYEDISEGISDPKAFEGISTCTSVNFIGGNIVVCEKINQREENEDTQVIVFDQTASNTRNEFTLGKFASGENYIFNFTQVLSIFCVKRQKQSEFSQNDEYGLVLGYYDDQEYEPDRRYISFLKGNILKEGSKLQIRAFDLFLSPTEDRSFYYDENNQKIPFQVQIISTKMIKIIMIEHHDIVFVVDCRLPFQKLNLYTLQPVHEIKLQDKKYFKGICLMKSMLDCERKVPTSESNPTCDMICKDFEGEFMSLYFAAKETELTVPFPESLLILADNKIVRKYAIETFDSIEEDKTEQIKKRLTQIFPKERVYRIKNKNKLELNRPIADSIKSQHAPNLKIQQKPKQTQKLKEQKGKRSLFGENSNVSNLFQKIQSHPSSPLSLTSGTLFGANKQAPSTGLFNKPATGPSNFDAKPTIGGTGFSLFDKKQTQTTPTQTKAKSQNPLFGAIKNQQKSEGGLFGQSNDKSGLTNIFSNVDNKQNLPNFLSGKTQQIKPTGSLFDKVGEQKKPSLFPQTSAPGDAFDKKTQKEKTQKGNMEKNKPEPKAEQPKSSIFGNNVSSLFNASSDQKATLKSQTLQNVPKSSESIEKSKKQNKSAEGLSFDRIKLGESQTSVPKKQKDVEMQAKSNKPQSNQAPKVQVKKQPIPQKKPVNLDKLKELATFFGHTSSESIPAPLLNLTDEQIDALIAQMSLVLPKKEEQKKSHQQIARQKLLKNEHLTKILQNIDETKNYLKNLKQANEVITSPTIFTLNNAQQLAKSTSQIRGKPEEELKSKNPLSNLVKNYTQRMIFLQKQYLNLAEAQNINPNNSKAFEQPEKVKQQKIMKEINLVEQGIHCLIVNQQKVSMNRSKTFSFLEKQQNLEQKLTLLVKQKAENCNKVIHKVSKMLAELEEEHQKPIKSRVSSVKSSSILTIASKNDKKKGHFAFSLESSESDEEANTIANRSILNDNQINKIPKKNSNILIKFQSKAIDMTSHQAKSFTPLAKLSEFSAPVHQNNEAFNVAALFGASANQMQNSIKKSVNFKEKIPFKKDDEEKIKKIFKFGESEDLDAGSNDQDQDDIVPEMGRNISKINTQGLWPKKQQQKPVPIQSVPQQTSKPQMKKTIQTNVPEIKGAQDKIKNSAQAFGLPPQKNEAKDEKKQTQKQEQSNIFSGVTNSKLFGGRESKIIEPDSKVQAKKQEKSLIGGALAVAGLFSTGINNGSKPEESQKDQKEEKKEQKIPSDTKKQQKKVEKKQPAGLFGKISSTPVSGGGLFGPGSLFPNLAPSKAQQTKPTQPAQKSIQNLPEQTKTTDQLKAQQESKEEKKPSVGLFGSENKNTLFGNNTSTLFTKKDEPPKTQTTETKPKSQEQKVSSSFGSGSSKSLFGNTGNTGGLFAQATTQKAQQQKPKTQTQPQSKPLEQPKPQVNPFEIASNEQKDKQEKKPTTSLFSVNKPAESVLKSEVPPVTKVQTSNSVANSQNANQFLGDNAGSDSGLGQQASNPSGPSGGLFNQQKPAQTFGATNRFMAQEQPAVQSQQTQGFNPNAMNFSGDNSFGQTAGTGIKSFSSFTGNQPGGLFGQGTSNQTQGTSLFGNANPMENPVGKGGSGSGFGGGPSGQGIFDNLQSGSGMFGSVAQPQANQGTGNFLSGFNLNQSTMNIPSNTGTVPNASMFKARK